MLGYHVAGVDRDDARANVPTFNFHKPDIERA